MIIGSIDFSAGVVPGIDARHQCTRAVETARRVGWDDTMSLALDPTDRGPDDDVPRPITTEEAFEALSNRRRRFVIRLLADGQADIELRELSRRVAAWENDKPVERVTATERRRVYNALQQFHLPKLDEQGVVDFDERAGVVELTPAAEDIDIYLEVVEGRDIPWSQFYLGLAAVDLGLLVAASVGTFPLTLISGIGWGIFVATTFLVSAFVHTYVNRTEMRLGDNEKPLEVEG